jgi:voltage-gated potassium channel Kch
MPFWILLVLLALAAFGLGYAGLSKALARNGQATSPLDILYLTFQLFTLESGSQASPVPWQLEVARFLAPLVAAWAIVRAVATLFREQLEAARMRWWRGHVVVCGLGRKGMAVVHDCLQKDLSVIAIESNEDNDAIHTCRELGVPVILGDSTDLVLLRKARAGYASLVCAGAGEDGRNVEIAMQIRACAIEAATGLPLTCFIHLVDLGLCNMLATRSLGGDGLEEDFFQVRVFNVFDNAARLLLNRFSLEDPPSCSPNPRRPHLIVVGLGRMGAAVALQAVKVCQYADEHPLRLTVIDTAATQRQGHLCGCFPSFRAVCEAEFVSGAAEDADVLDRIGAWAKEPAFRTTVVVCFDSDSHAVMAGLRISEYLAGSDAQVLVRMSEAAGLAALIRPPYMQDEVMSRVHPFGTIAEACGLEMLLNTEIDRLAVVIHEAYVEERRSEGRPESHPAMQPWSRLAPMYKDSNRQQADHIFIKLRMVGCHAVLLDHPGERVDSFTPEEIEYMARMEHARWCAERRLGGWTYAPDRDDHARKHPNLLPWSQLTEPIRNIDRQSVKKIPQFLATVGQAVCRNARDAVDA